MRQQRVAMRWVWIGLLFVVAAAGLTSAVGTTGAAPDGTVVSAPDSSSGNPPTPDDPTPTACKKAPQCSTDVDCFAWCGPTGGHCVHSSCPTRICKCS